MQLMCSADSVAANIAEAGGRWTLKDKRHFLYIARGSLLETEHWIDCAVSRGLLKSDLDGQVTEIARLLNGLISPPRPRQLTAANQKLPAASRQEGASSEPRAGS